MSDAGLLVQPALGVGGIVGDSFGIFFRRIHWFVLLAALPLLVVYGVIALTVGSLMLDPYAIGSAGNRLAGPGGEAVGLLMQVAQVVAFSVTGAFMVLAAYDAKLGAPVRLRDYLASAFRHIVPLVLCSIVVWIGLVIGMLLFVVPGLWVMAVWSAVIPAIVIERAGFSSLGRSAALTKGYRWPIVGTMIVLAICMMIFSMILLSITGAVVGMIGGVPALVAAVLLYSAASAAGYGVFYIGVALIYARLREIKEGTSVEALTEVFA